jgi:hypothetical protein
MSAPRRERGKAFHLSLSRVALRAGAFFLLLAFGVFVGYIGGAIIYSAYNNPQGTQWGFVCGCGSPILLRREHYWSATSPSKASLAAERSSSTFLTKTSSAFP